MYWTRERMHFHQDSHKSLEIDIFKFRDLVTIWPFWLHQSPFIARSCNYNFLNAWIDFCTLCLSKWSLLTQWILAEENAFFVSAGRLMQLVFQVVAHSKNPLQFKVLNSIIYPNFQNSHTIFLLISRTCLMNVHNLNRW